MKANELMIGDLVRVNRDGLCIRKNTIVEIRGVDGDNKFEGLVGCASCMPTDKWQLFGGIWCDYLEPIPLTPEIMEKNGWEHKWWWVHPSTCICFQEKITGDFRAMPNTECDKRDCFATIKYVHELQHLYKLCGIDKEIVL